MAATGSDSCRLNPWPRWVLTVPLRSRDPDLRRGERPVQGLLDRRWLRSWNSELWATTACHPGGEAWLEALGKGVTQKGQGPERVRAPMGRLCRIRPCSPCGAGLGVAGVHLGRPRGQRCTPGGGQRREDGAPGPHAAHRPLLQAAPTGGAAWAEVSSCPAGEERSRALALAGSPGLLVGMGGRQADPSG